jgi:hypothetical protein
MTPIIKGTAGKSRDIQIRVLIQLQRLLLLTLIPGPFPDMNRDVSSTDDSFPQMIA